MCWLQKIPELKELKLIWQGHHSRHAPSPPNPPASRSEALALVTSLGFITLGFIHAVPLCVPQRSHKILEGSYKVFKGLHPHLPPSISASFSARTEQMIRRHAHGVACVKGPGNESS